MIFLPFISSPSAPSSKGLAFTTPPNAQPNCADLARLGVTWWHSWSPNPPCPYPGFVPFSWAGLDIPLADENGYAIWLNEPEIADQANISPQEAAARYAAFRAAHPTTKIVAANANIWAGDWLTAFWSMIADKPAALGVHVYIQEWLTVTEAGRRLDELHSLTGAQMWVTEFGVLDGDPETFKALLYLFASKPYLERWAAYTARQYGEWYDLPPGVELIQGSSFTPCGAVYAQR